MRWRQTSAAWATLLFVWTGAAHGQPPTPPETTTAEPASPDATVDLRVLWLEGSVAVSAGQDATTEPIVLKVQIADRLHPGEVITLERGARLWLLGEQAEVMAAEGPLELAVGVEGVSPVAEAVGRSEGTWKRIQIAGLPGLSEPPIAWEAAHGPAGRTADEPGLLALEPVETSVRDPRPALRWRLPEGRDRVDLTLWRLEQDGSLTPIEVWRGLHGTELRPWQALDRQRYYLWQARALMPPPSQSSEDDENLDALDARVAVWFRVLGRDDDATVRRAMTALSKHQADHPHSAMALQVLRALLLERYGLLEEAEQAWSLIAARRLDREGLERRLERLRKRRLIAPRRNMRLPSSTYGVADEELELPPRAPGPGDDKALGPRSVPLPGGTGEPLEGPGGQGSSPE